MDERGRIDQETLFVTEVSPSLSTLLLRLDDVEHGNSKYVAREPLFSEFSQWK